MSERKYSPILVGVVALVFVVIAVALLWRVVNGDSSLLRNVVVQKSLITPNADLDDDATLIEYELSRNAAVSIYFENEAGQRFYFRQEKTRGAGEYRVAFSGVVDGYTLPDEQIVGDVQTRLLADGTYSRTVLTTDDEGVTEQVQGQLAIAEADPIFPELRALSIDRDVFTPNRDGIGDRALVQFFLTKDVDQLRVFLLGSDGQEYPMEEKELDVPARGEGWHYYDYEGGVDDGATPPPDGTYPVVVVAQDIEGQRIEAQDELTIQYGGVPRARIFPPPNGDTLQLSATAVAICDTLFFTITVENYGTTPVRTTGPEPGTVYDSDWNYNTLGWHTESGAFRLAIGYENEISNYPYRWAVGNADDLVEIDGYTYLMPGERAIVTGGIRLVNVFGDRNPQPLWAGLIHEDVEISEYNDRVDSHSILVDIPDAANMPECPARDIPMKPKTN